MDVQPLKEYVLAQRKKIHQIQVCIEEARCKIVQIDSILEEILDTTSYFGGPDRKDSVDRNK